MSQFGGFRATYNIENLIPQPYSRIMVSVHRPVNGSYSLMNIRHCARFHLATFRAL